MLIARPSLACRSPHPHCMQVLYYSLWQTRDTILYFADFTTDVLVMTQVRR